MKSTMNKKKKLAESGTLNLNADKVKDPIFKTNKFFDPDDLLQLKYEMLRRVDNEGKPVTEVTNNFGFSRRHFYVLQKQFKESGLQGLLSEKRGPKGGHKLSSKIMTFVYAQLEKDSSLKTPAIGAIIERQFGIKAHRRSIERALARKKKVPNP